MGKKPLVTYTISLDDIESDRDTREAKTSERLEFVGSVAEQMPGLPDSVALLGQIAVWLSKARVAPASFIGAKVSPKLAEIMMTGGAKRQELAALLLFVNSELESYDSELQTCDIELVANGITFADAKYNYLWTGTLMETRFQKGVLGLNAVSPKDLFLLYHPDPQYLPPVSNSVKIVQMENNP